MRTLVLVTGIALVTGCTSVKNGWNVQTERGKEIATFRPKPLYPIEARRDRIQGYGVAVLWVAPDGTVRRAEMLQSTGYAVLDQATLEAYRRWRFKPGLVKKVKIPVTFSM
jgi:TonB family protein